MLRKLVMALVAVIVLIVVAVVLVIVFVDPNDYREPISTQASTALGRPVHLNGPLGLKVFPRIALEINDVTVGNPEGFPADQPLAQIGSAVASVQLLPLLKGQVLVGDVELNQAQINLLTIGEVDAQTASNLAGLIAEETEADAPQTDLSKIQTGAIRVNDLQITQANLTTGDAQNIRIESIALGAFSANTDVPLRVRGNIFNGQEHLVEDLDISMSINIAADLSRIAIADIELEAGLPSAGAKLAVAANGEVSSLDPVQLGFDRFKLDAQMDDGTSASVSSPVQITVGTSTKLTMVNVQAKASMADGTEVVLTSPVTVDVGEVINVALPELSAQAMLPAQNMNVLFNGPLRASLTEAPKLVLGQSNIKINEQVFSAQGDVQLGLRPRLNLKVAGDTFDLNPLLAASESSGSEASTTAGPGGQSQQGGATTTDSGAAAAEPDLTALRSWTMDVDLRLKRLLMPNLNLENVVGVMKARDGLITLDPLSASLFQGQFEGVATIDARQDPPAVHLQPRLRGVAVEAMLLAFSPAAPARGAGSLDLDIRFNGLDMKKALNSLQGKGAFTVEDGAIIGVDLNRLLNEEMSRSNLGNIRNSFGGETVFEVLSGEFNAESGVLQLPAMDMETLQFGLSGNGSLDLTQQTLDYDMTLNLGEQLRGQMPKRLMDVTNGVIPLKLSGPVTAPIVTVDVETLLQSAVQKEVKKRGKKLLNNIFKRLDKKTEEDQATEDDGNGGG